MNLNPIKVLEKKIITNSTNECIQQVGIDLRINVDVILKPLSSKNVSFVENFNMQDYFGIIQIRSSFSRMGIFVTSGIYDPGFCGVGGVTIYNLSNKEINLTKFTRICQIVVFKAEKANFYNGHYNNNSIKSKLDLENFDEN